MMAEKDVEELGARPRTMTEKGYEYHFSTKRDRLFSLFGVLQRQTDTISSLISTVPEGEAAVSRKNEVQMEYKKWLDLYSKYMEIKVDIEAIVREDDADEFTSAVTQQQVVLGKLKSDVEQYLLALPSPVPKKRLLSKAPTVMSRHSRHSAASKISNSLVEEKQKEVELLARAKALKKKHQLELAKFQIEMQKEELELNTKIEITQAKAKVLNDLENDLETVSLQEKGDPGGDNRDDFVEDVCPEQVQNQREFDVPLFNPHALPFTPKEQPLQNLEALESVVKQLRKPLPDIDKFSGNPMDFRRFMRQFYSKILANCETDDERLQYFEQFTDGDAKKIVRGFSYLDSSAGFNSAMKELEDCYGNIDLIAGAFTKKALDWPPIRRDDSKTLHQFSVFLTECEHVVLNINSASMLEHPDTLRKLVQKLPLYFHDKWRNIVQKARDEYRPITFSHLAQFVKRECKKIMDPIFGGAALSSGFSSQKRQDVRQRSRVEHKSFATNLKKDDSAVTRPIRSENFVFRENTSNNCLYCSKSHCIQTCFRFLAHSVPERLMFLKSKGICFRCLTKGHIAKSCDKVVSCDKCMRNHQTLLHVDSQPGMKSETMPKGVNMTETSAGTDARVPKFDMEAGECTLAVVPVKIALTNSSKVVDVYAFLDPGSTVTFCSSNLLNTLGCNGRRVDITVDTMGESFVLNCCAVTGLQVYDPGMQNVVTLPTVYSKDKIPVSRRHIPTSEDTERWTHLSNITIPHLDSGIELVIGNNVPEAYAPLQIQTGPEGSPHATKTKLGWVVWNLIRPSEDKEYKGTCMMTDVAAVRDREEMKMIETIMMRDMNFDFPERNIDDKKEMSGEDKMFMKSVKESIKLTEGQYFISLPFKKEKTLMPDNHEIALKRLYSLKQKLKRNEQFHSDYKVFMEDIINKGYAEQVPEEEVPGKVGTVWYIPHHGVYHPRKPGKIRVVFDCTASYQGVSLNSMLLQGPDLSNNLLGILLRFRRGAIAVMSDIESMFYRVRVPAVDCDFQRFFWYPEGDINKEPAVYRMSVHMFGTVSSPACATFALQQAVDDNEHLFSEETVNLARTSFYVDDFLASKDEVDQAMVLVEEMRDLCSRGGFRLTKWTSNDHAVMQSIPVEERAKNTKSLNLECEELPNERALGVYWTVESDSLSFKISPKSKPNTRRGILCIVSSVFDPIGLVGPFVLTAKQLLQTLCKSNTEWDEEIDDIHLQVWQKWKTDMLRLEEVQISRCYRPKNFGVVTSCQLHIFADASERGYGVVAYLRLMNSNSDKHCAFIMSKSRVAPLKKITIPRMELTAATLAVRLYKVLIDELEYPLETTTFWTDSMSVLRYIRNDTSRFKTFVANRLTVIKEATDVQQWKHVDTDSNPADLASRGVSIDKLLKDQQWFQGPAFLYLPEEAWTETKSSAEISDSDPEVKRVVTCTITKDHDPLQRLIRYYSDWSKLKRAVGWILLVKKRLLQKTRMKKQETGLVTTNKLDVDVLQQAELTLISYCQKQDFKTEIDLLTDKEVKTNKEVKTRRISKTSPLYKLDPIVQDDILRVGGRIGDAHAPFDTRHPIILSKNSPVSLLILNDAHKAVGHLGRSSVLSFIRQRYWILGSAKTVRSILSKCVICKRYRASAEVQKMANIPKERLESDVPPFTHVGMDYFGPFLVKRGRAVVKKYGVVFTCMTMRAVHLEVADSLSTDSCISTIRRFISRRGSPRTIRSDNGTNLVGSRNELRDELGKLNQSRIHSTLLNKGIDWYFNPSGASHHGGIWERMIRSVRQILNALMSEQTIRLNDESLYTLFCEVECIINNRPLTAVSPDPSDLTALTPNQLLTLKPGETVPPGLFSKEDSYGKRRWKQVQYLANIFWKRWVKDYLPMLQERTKWISTKRNVSVNDLVLLVDNTPRNSWKMGRISEVYPDKKGYVRVVKVKTAGRDLIRPINKLCVILEVND